MPLTALTFGQPLIVQVVGLADHCRPLQIKIVYSISFYAETYGVKRKKYHCEKV